MLNIVICEDEKVWLNNLLKIIEKTIKKNNIDANIVLKSNNIQQVKDFLAHNSANVFFLDIDFNEKETGYSLAHQIRESNIYAYIVFVTAHMEYLMQAFKVQAFDFLPKPVASEILSNTLLNIYENYNQRHLAAASSESNRLTIKTGTIISSINMNDIVFIEKVSYQTIIHLTHNKTKICRLTLDYLETELSSNNFIRCHRSYIVNKKYISEIHTKEQIIILDSGETCLIGSTYKKLLLKSYSIIP